MQPSYDSSHNSDDRHRVECETAAFYIRTALNENEALRALANDMSWVPEHVISRCQGNLLPAYGWLAMTKALRFECVQTPEHVETLAAAFVDPRDYSECADSFQQVLRFFEMISQIDPFIPFTKLCELTKFLVQVSLDTGLNGLFCVERLQDKILKSADPSRALQIAEIFARLYCAPDEGTPPERHAKFKHQARIALQSGEELPGRLIGSFMLMASSLPTEQSHLLLDRWQDLQNHLPTDNEIPLQIEEIVSAVKRINRSLGFVACSSATPRLIANLMILYPNKARWIASTVEFLAERPGQAAVDIDFLFRRLNSERAFPSIERRFAFAKHHDISLGDVPQEAEGVPVLWQRSVVAQLMPNGVSDEGKAGKLSAIRGVVPLLSMLGELLKKKNDDEGRFTLPVIARMVTCFDKVKSSHHLWNTDVAAEVMVRFFDKSTEADAAQCVQTMRIALAAHHRLVELKYASGDALRVSLAVASNLSNQDRPNPRLVRTIFTEDPRTELLTEMRRAARSRKIDDEDFARSLRFASDVFPNDWRDLSLSQVEFGRFQRLPLPEIRQVLGSSQLSSAKQIHEAVTERVVRRRLIDFFYAPDQDLRKKAGRELNDIYVWDTGPYPVSKKNEEKLDPRYVRMLREVKACYRGLFDVHYGFDHLTYEFRTPPGGEDWLAVRFARDCAVRVDRFNTDSIDQYPGPGCIISGMRLDRILAKNPQTPDDPYSHFKQAFPWASGEIEDSADTRYIFLRGAQAWIGPDSEKYYLDGVHYSKLVWNEHFLNPKLEAGVLVPTKVLLAAIKGKHSQINELGERPLITPHNTAHNQALTLDSLTAACEASGLNILNLGWASNVGGLCNAYPERSAPHFTWERQRQKETKDRAGHVHKSHIAGGWAQVMNSEVDRLNQPLRELHTRVHQLDFAYRSLDYLGRLYRSYWKKGWTLTDDVGEDAELDLESSQESEQEEAGPDELGRNELRMLVEAHRWHALRDEGVSDPSRFPILCLTRTFDYWTRVRSPITLDTYDLSLKLSDGSTVQLRPGTRGTSAFEAGLWSRHIRPLIRRGDVDLRFVHGEYIDHDSD